MKADYELLLIKILLKNTSRKYDNEKIIKKKGVAKKNTNKKYIGEKKYFN